MNSQSIIDSTTIAAAGELTSAARLGDLVQTVFPPNQLIHAFGYGSGVFSQGHDGKAGMLDLILVVKDAQAWHQENQRKNPNHYASLFRCMDQEGMMAATVQRSLFRGKDAKLFFHVVDDDNDEQETASQEREQEQEQAPLKIPPLKYGVIHYEDFIQDLTQWQSLYIAGRLHKPTMTIPLDQSLGSSASLLSNTTNDEQMLLSHSLKEAKETNLRAAVAAAMLLSPIGLTATGSTTASSPFLLSWPQLYAQIASLSYSGDFRMKTGAEDPEKIQKLVHTPGQFDRFHALYGGVREHPSGNHSSINNSNNNNNILGTFEDVGLLSINENGIEWAPYDVYARSQLIQRLPPRVQHNLLQLSSTPTSSQNRNSNTIMVENHLIEKQQQIVAKTLEAIVSPAAKYQSLKGLITFGLRKSIRYASAKLSKGILRKR